ncbi:hypothetical protein ACFWGC_26625 [Cytobacillus pseudoceanisediminis]|uniref:hypothetical protein n=1 Tax=Cytobacillus pseudoceanisediminis TaxID=3051614 RepID=UPI0036482AF0
MIENLYWFKVLEEWIASLPAFAPLLLIIILLIFCLVVFYLTLSEYFTQDTYKKIKELLKKNGSRN